MKFVLSKCGATEQLCHEDIDGKAPENSHTTGFLAPAA